MNKSKWMKVTIVVMALSVTGVLLFSQRPLEIRQELVQLQAQDGGRSKGAYHYLDGSRPRTAVLIMHPPGDSTLHFILQPLAKEGLGALGMLSRSPGYSGIHDSFYRVLNPSIQANQGLEQE